MHLHHLGHKTWCKLTWELITQKKLNCVTSNLLREKVVQTSVNYEESLKQIKAWVCVIYDFYAHFPKTVVKTSARKNRYYPICCNFCMVLSMFFRLVLANYLFSLRDINLKLGLLPSRRHVVWRDSVGVRSSRSGLKSECADIFSSEPHLWSLRHTDESQRGRNSCLWLQSRSVFSSFGVVLMFCRLILTQYDQHCSILLVEFNMSIDTKVK